jgi:hypothetical protein
MPREDIVTARGPKPELHSDDIKIDQRRPLADLGDRDGDVILADPSVAHSDYLAELAFMEEPVTIRLEPSADRNAISRFAVWVNGAGAEVFQRGRWEAIGWLPVGQVIIVKRKVLEVIVRTKIDTLHTEVRNPDSETPFNTEQRFTSAVHSFSVIEDKSPRGAAWLTEMRRRNF